jgi:tetratricopeptide (TPR) repeat protein
MAVSRHQLPEEGNLAHAKELYQKALAIDSNSAEAYAGLGALETVMNADFLAADHWFQRSLSARPQDAFTHFSYARLVLIPRGRLEQAVSELTKAIALEPLEAEMRLLLCRTHLYRHDWESAITAGTSVLQLSVDSKNGFYGLAELADAYAFAGRWNQFTDLRNHCCTSGADRLWTQLLIANGAGSRLQVAQITDKLLTAEADELKRAVLFSLRGDLPSTIASLKTANETQRTETRIIARNSPYFDAFRSRPEFQALLRSMRLLS